MPGVTAIVSLQHAKDIHPAIDTPLTDELLPAGRGLWTPAQLRDLTRTLSSHLTASLLDTVQFTEDRRWWLRLALTSGVEVWLLSWAPGQGTEPHDHGGASGAFTVLFGALDEEYRFPRSAVETAVRRAGDTVAFGPNRAHRLRSSQPAATVHAYSPPLRPVREYRTLADFTGEAGTDELLNRARAGLARVTAREAARWQGDGAVLVDIRPYSNRLAEGEIPGAVVVERIVLEWRLDPTGEHRLPGLTAKTPVVIFCNEGYASSLAAADARALGLVDVTDVVGGFRAWQSAGLPTAPGGTPAAP